MIREQAILELVEQIARAFSIERIILFGSHAYGTPGEGSDVDLLVVMPFDGRSRDQSHAVWNAVRPSFSVDLLVRRPEDVARRYEQWDPLIREAVDKGRVLYERNRSGMVAKGAGRPARGSA